MRKLLQSLPIIGPHFKYYEELKQHRQNCGYHPGHYYSPIPDLQELQQYEQRIFSDREPKEVNLNTEEQIALMHELQTNYKDYPYFDSTSGYRYKKEKAFYRFSDAIFLYLMIRHFKPVQIIEVGSGDSSAVMLDVSDKIGKINMTFIEPYPEERLLQKFKADEKPHILKSRVQDVPVSEFERLGKNDILFIDSTHVSKTGSDLNYLLFEVLPALQPGVLIHFHDIFYPFEMPRSWVMEHKWFWNENYLLHAFLMNNVKYKIIIFNTYLQKIQREWFENNMPECLIGADNTGSIWLQKQ